MKNTLYLHIGSEKTGTASIHKFLAHNGEQLSREGLTYFTEKKLYYSKFSTAHSPIVACFFPEPPDYINPAEYTPSQRLLPELEADLLKENKRVILSSEHFSSRLRSTDDMEKLKSAMKSFDVYVICYMRAQFGLYFSSYSTAVINGRREAPSESEIHLDNHYLNYVELLKPWAQVFGKEKVIVRNYNDLGGLDVCDDFLRLLGVRDVSTFRKIPRANRSVKPKSAEMIRKLNAYLPGYGEQGYTSYSILIELRWLISSLIEIFHPHQRNDYASLKRKVESIFEQSNKELFATYADHIEPRPAEPAPSPEAPPSGKIAAGP